MVKSLSTNNPRYGEADMISCCSCGEKMEFSIVSNHRCNVCRVKIEEAHVWLRCSNPDCDSDICVISSPGSEYSCLDTWYHIDKWLPELLALDLESFHSALSIAPFKSSRVLWYTMVYDSESFEELYARLVDSGPHQVLSRVAMWFTWCFTQVSPGLKQTLMNLLLYDPRVSKEEFYEQRAFRSVVRGGHKELLLQLERAGFHVNFASSALRTAALLRDTEMLRFLLSLDFIDPTESHSAALRAAAARGHAISLDILLQDGRSDPTARNNSSFYLASKHGHLACTELLLADGRVDPQFARSALVAACKQGHVLVARAILADGRLGPEASYNRELRGACSNGHLEVVQLLITETGTDPSGHGSESLYCAISNGHIEVAMLLLSDDRVQPHARRNRALQAAVVQGATDLVDVLLGFPTVSPPFAALRLTCEGAGAPELLERMMQDPGCDPTARENRLLRTACRSGLPRVVEVLLRHPAVSSTIDCTEALVSAAKSNSLETFKLLLERSDMRETIRKTRRSCVLKASVGSLAITELVLDLAKRNGKFSRSAAFVVACRSGTVDVVRRLLEDPRADPCTRKGIALLNACANPTPVLPALLEVEPLVRLMKKRRLPLLRICCEEGNPQGALVLLDHGEVDPKWDDDACLEIACANGYTEVVERLLQDTDVDVTKSRYKAFRVASNWAIREILYPRARPVVYFVSEEDIDMPSKLFLMTFQDRLLGLLCVEECFRLPLDILGCLWDMMQPVAIARIDA